VIGRIGKVWRTHRAAAVLVALAGAFVVLVASIVAARVVAHHEDRIPANVRVGDVEVGGLSVADARRAVAAAAEPDVETLSIRGGPLGRDPLEVPVASLGPEPAIGPAIERARARRSLWGRVLSEIGVGHRREVPLDYELEERAVRSLAGELARRVDRAPKDAAVRVGSSIRVTAARPGRRVREDVLVRRLRRLDPEVALPVETVTAEVTTVEARRAAARARRVVAGGVVVAGGGRQARLEPADLRAALRFTRRDGRIVVRLDAATLRAALREPFSGLIRPARSAGFSITGDSVRLVPALVGRRLDAEAVAGEILRRPESGRVRVRFAPVDPERTTAEARSLRIREEVASFTTEYACCQPRVTNIRLGAAALDGQIIPPGGRFSLNEAMGQRTEARGFVAAPQINDGELEDAVGGGVSQIATTVFNAGWFAGLRIETHTPHQFYISRYPLGREATVSWGGPELVLVNDWPAAILISAKTTDTSITVRFFSSKLGRRVTTETVELPGRGAPAARYSRTVFRGDEVHREDSYTWYYDAAPG
jgi:vancomycin resistance protein YoaR